MTISSSKVANALTMNLAYKFFEAAHMQRWNDHLRPVEFTELDKQAHKMTIAWALASFQVREKGDDVDWSVLIESAMFSFLQRIVITDLKPPIFHRIKREKGKELNEYVLREINAAVPNMEPALKERFKDYLATEDRDGIEHRILKAAHYLATKYEFDLVYAANPSMMGVEDTRRNIEMQIEDHYDLIGVQRIQLQKRSHGFVEFCGQLRFQQRWSRSPRIPRTTVLGHMLLVANMAYLHSLDLGLGKKRACNNYFCALFHDLPEVLTKDIISPVKRSVEGLEEVLDEMEKELVEEKLLPLLPSQWHADFRYLLMNPFDDRKRVQNGDELKRVPLDEGGLPADDDDEIDAVDGTIVKACDLLAAFMEATISIKYGISSRALSDGKEDLYKVISERFPHFSGLMKDIDNMDI